MPKAASIDLNKTVGFFDATCPKCKARIGWHGKITDRPPCRQCGHLETINIDAEQQRMLNLDYYCKIQTIYFNHYEDLSGSEKIFVRKMYEQYPDKLYADEQMTSIQRIHDAVGAIDD